MPSDIPTGSVFKIENGHLQYIGVLPDYDDLFEHLRPATIIWRRPELAFERSLISNKRQGKNKPYAGASYPLLFPALTPQPGPAHHPETDSPREP